MLWVGAVSKKRGAKPDFATHPDTGEEIEGLYINRDKRGKVRFYYYLNKEGKRYPRSLDDDEDY